MNAQVVTAAERADLTPRPLYRPGARPMRVAFFASGGPGNVQAAFEVERAAPWALQIGLVVTDRPGIPAIAVAREHGRTVLVRDFAAACGNRRDWGSSPADLARYHALGEAFHDRVLDELQTVEAEQGWPFDLAVLAYRRIIRGRLLAHFQGRMINQHPADLASFDPQSPGGRRYVGIEGHRKALREQGRGRTCTILVREGVDTGEILCHGPWLPFAGDPENDAEIAAHEDAQKRASDWPALQAALAGIAVGRFGLFADRRHTDGCQVVSFDGEPLPYEGRTCQGADHLRFLEPRPPARAP